jgi:hypothetical protein
MAWTFSPHSKSLDEMRHSADFILARVTSSNDEKEKLTLSPVVLFVGRQRMQSQEQCVHIFCLNRGPTSGSLSTRPRASATASPKIRLNLRA